MNEKLRREVVKYVPKEIVVTINKVRRVEIPKDKIIYKIKKVPREVIDFKEVTVEVPVHREELIFIDAAPAPPIIKHLPVIREIQKQILIKNPQSELTSG
jgi:hypothetical protein